MSALDIRWKQRLQNFEKSMSNFEAALALPQPDLFQKAGLIQFFEMSFELAWKTLKDHLEAEGHLDVSSPRAALKKGFEIGLIQDGHAWLKALEDRNLTSHVYDEATAEQVLLLIRDCYAALLRQLLDEFHRRA